MEKVRLVVRNLQSNKNELNRGFDCLECKKCNDCMNAKSCDMITNAIVQPLQNTFGKKFDDYVSYGYDSVSKTTTFYAEIGHNPNQTQNVMAIINKALRRYKKTYKTRGSR